MRRWMAAVAVVLVGAGGLVACGDEPSGPVSILVAGDSYSAGNGAGDFTDPDGCRRSPNNYGAQLAAILVARGQDATAATVACSGGTTDDVVEQAAAVDATHDLVLVTVGGNDVGFTGVVTACLIALLREERRCDQALDRAEAAVADGSLARSVQASVAALQRAAHDDATVVLVGYPRLEGDPAFELGAVAVGERLDALATAGDRVQGDVAEALDAAGGAGVVFVPVADAFRGHELRAAAPAEAAWFVNPVLGNPIADWYHPSRRGHRAIAELLASSDEVPLTDTVP